MSVYSTKRPMTLDAVPNGYITGVGRSPEETKQVTHLYKGTFDKPGLPMCVKGWNRDNGESYSIWRNNISSKGICKVCLRRAQQGLEGVPSPVSVEKYKKRKAKARGKS